jgi:hypothetical protein
VIWMEVCCDTCASTFSDRSLNIVQMRRKAKAEGWRASLIDGKLKDFCPTCSDIMVNQGVIPALGATK